jgi:hypothetical protein
MAGRDRLRFGKRPGFGKRLGKTGLLVKKSRKSAFDPKMFLAKVGEGKIISKYQKDQIVFSQAEVADAVFLHPEGTHQAHRGF